MESAPAMEIDKDAFGNFYLMIPTSWLESKQRFPHLPTGPAATNRSGVPGLGTKRCLLDRKRKRRRNPVPDVVIRWPVLR